MVSSSENAQKISSRVVDSVHEQGVVTPVSTILSAATTMQRLLPICIYVGVVWVWLTVLLHILPEEVGHGSCDLRALYMEVNCAEKCSR